MEGLLLHVDSRNEAIGDIRCLVLEEGQLHLYSAARTTLLASYDLETVHAATALVTCKARVLPHQFCIELHRKHKLVVSLRFAAPSLASLLAWRNAIHHWRRKVFDASPVTTNDLICELAALLGTIEMCDIEPRKRPLVTRRFSLPSIKPRPIRVWKKTKSLATS
ncbi:hypothetical protein SPRG_07114 [Saprolegnia parasitica CBS 223.65]|uniref:PH domain-containing protein n=1 Tax=Saprolegnia parasitica (strain CBS 223.65) TaxID=695850 RepID=A0A067CMS9_SAPPC|nr:hypothetical protein SPRG_07114 [Saprolegnia parasitica CBS 223.65]KDO27841.1 hypothetical protein SPRG_07114 [Saprolegnia parasitica CBS 223.65]|eukprot:XP_012201301.1 hypothetical protein SPRG_07114 [Saprolegnia parasitica CBS 223.65]